ncbi:cytochrome b/b6 domain-containing protein [Asticcacaulis sp. AC402]|uniref:cytochrome b/b6 domain-containing protein n=1 Tax=Asticcacaulis sp. AC402 TaxID=1282361 RepID=UPI0003C3D4C4|nr:cytochrome b/b6 domain-containing protein [Asticcacaulis sp. AC402]ESQ77585.1 cytochrome B561 [Asticcacaulis sp. AC402]
MTDDSDRTSIHPWWLRMVHWLNAAAVIILILSGWQIYNATGFMGFKFPREVTLGRWLGGGIMWHFAAMWLLWGVAAFYLIMATVTGRWKRQFWPVSPGGILRDLKDTFTGKLSHADLRVYNYVQKAAYLFVMLDIVVLICSGLVLWKPVQFPTLRTLLGDYEGARLIHFIAMVVMCGFIVVHVVMALLVPKTIKAMLWGR